MPPKHPESCLVLSRVEIIVPVLSALMIVRRSERRIRVRKGIDVDDLGWFTENPKKTCNRHASCFVGLGRPFRR